MRRLFILCALLAVCQFLAAQPQRGLKGYNTEEYPKVSFIWNSPNPDVLDQSIFTLKDENNENLFFDFSALDKKDTSYKKSILFLWEDMKSHSRQTDNTRILLKDFFDRTNTDANTEFNVAVFNRKSSNEKALLKPLMSDFSANTVKLATVVEEYQKSTRDFGKNEYSKSTDLYMAINEGIDMLKREPDNRVGIIVVITAGLNMKAAGASTELESVRNNAEKAGIPIYVIKYHELAGDPPEINSLAESTYGQVIRLTDKHVGEAVVELQALYRNLDSRCSGQDYKFTFTTSAKRDGKPHGLKLTVNKVDQPIRPFTAPEMTFGIWVKENLLLFILLVLLLIGLIVMTILLIVLGAKKRKKRAAENEAHLQQELQKEKEGRQRWENEQRNAQRQKEEAQRKEVERKAREAEDERLLQLMHIKNMYPRLQCSLDGNTFSHTINQVSTRLGRNETNDVVLPSQTVSGFHAEIRFNGAAFEVFNRSHSYTRGIIVNGQFFQQCTLKSGDKIGLGEAVIAFYL